MLREMIQEELKAALYRTIIIERGPRQQGDPEKVIKEEEWNVLDFFVTYLPKIEAALRGMQEDLDHTKNNVANYNKLLHEVGQTFMAMEQSAKKLAQFSDQISNLNISEFKPIDVTPKEEDESSA